MVVRQLLKQKIGMAWAQNIVTCSTHGKNTLTRDTIILP